MTALRHVLPMIASSIVLGGCLPVQPALYRQAAVATAPDLDCVRSKLTEALAVSDAGIETMELPGFTIRRVRYVRSNRTYYLGFSTASQGDMTMFHTTTLIDVTSRDVWELRASLRDIEWTLRGRCGLEFVMDRARERCIGPTCG
jgi:hypothetical protein